MPPANNKNINHSTHTQIYVQSVEISYSDLCSFTKSNLFWAGRAATKSKYINSLRQLLKATESTNSNQNGADKSDKTPWRVDTITPQQPATSLAEYNSSHTDVFELLRSWASLGKNPAEKLVITLDKVELVCSLLNCKCSYIIGNIFIEVCFSVNPQTSKNSKRLYSNYKNTAAGSHFSPTRWKMKYKYQADDPDCSDSQDIQRHLLANSLLQAEMNL